jgi:FAD dependent monooxygenase
MTPNIGQGANTAIEDAAVLASLINRVVCSTGSLQPTEDRIEAMLREYNGLRYERTKDTYERSRFGARFHTRDNWLKALVGRYAFQYVGGLIEKRITKSLAGGDMIEYLPRPQRSELLCVTEMPQVRGSPPRKWLLLWMYSLVLCLLFPWIGSYLHSTFW